MDSSLYLYATGNYLAYNIETLKQALVSHQICSLFENDLTTRPGAQLMQYINFLGCSPTLSTGTFDCTITLHRFSEPTGLGGKSLQTLRYPGCKHVIQQPEALLLNFKDNPRWRCTQCSNSGEITQLNWRKTAGISRLFIEITNIFPREALPNDRFLTLLKQASKADWLWFYSESSA